MPTIIFTQDHTVRNLARDHYHEGQIVDVDDSHATHFINREVAVLYVPKAEPEPEVKTVDAKSKAPAKGPTYPNAASFESQKPFGKG